MNMVKFRTYFKLTHHIGKKLFTVTWHTMKRIVSVGYRSLIDTMLHPL